MPQPRMLRDHAGFGLELHRLPRYAVEQIRIEEDALEYRWTHGDEAFFFAVEDDDGFIACLSDAEQLTNCIDGI